MRLIEGWQTQDPATRGAAAAIGNFDGVHLGHRALMAAARSAAERLGGPFAAVTFEPHPRRYFQPEAPAFRLTTAAEKARQIAGLGADALVRIPFDAHLANLDPEEFVAGVLARGLGLAHVAVGADFRFGHRRAGDAVMLRQLGARHGIGVTILNLVGGDEGEYASTSLRVLVEQGRMADAARMLGRWHAVTGEVHQGDQRGRLLGYPTANLAFGCQIVPRFGVYAARVEVLAGPHAGLHDGVASIGNRPTFGENTPNFEVHLFDFSGDLYGAPIAAGLVAFLRPELKFDGADALIVQMDADSRAAREILAHARLPAAEEP